MKILSRVTVFLLVVVSLTDVGLVARRQDTPGPAVPRREPATVDARRFLDRYVTSEGRVVRRDQGGDTVSEGQAYAMLLALVADDRGAFDRVWTWARTHLQRDDGLLAWRWADGHVVDQEAASDADLDAAWALALADRRWPAGDYATPAERLARAAVARETAALPDGRPVLVPGPWARDRAARGDGVVLNPSYTSPVGERVLVAAGAMERRSSDARQATSRALLVDLLDRGELPPDWLEVTPDGAVHSIASPEHPGGGQFGWDAVRVPLRLAASCHDDDRALAARLASALRDGAGSRAMGDHPARIVAVAAASAADGDIDGALELLDQASRAQARAPTYYGGALVALARALLTTDRLGSCPPA